MRQKLHRGRRSVFRRKRHPVLRAFGMAVACVGVVAVGFLGAKYFSEHPQLTPDTGIEQPTQSAPEDNTVPETSQPEQTPAAPVTPAPSIEEAIRGFYLPHSALSVDSLTDTSLFHDAKAAGFNAVIFDVKGADGTLYYQFSSPTAAKVGYAENALNSQQFAALMGQIREAGLVAIPRLYAFEDHLGAKALADARITPTGNNGWVWYDGDPQNGGRAWLNPYANAAHDYVLGLAQEMKTAGVAAVLLEGVHFPTQLSSASFGDGEHTQLAKDKVLALFVEKARETLGSDCPVILGCTALSALGEQTQVYGNNPLTFAPAMAAPAIDPATLPQSLKLGDHTVENDPADPAAFVEALVAQMILRTKVMESGKQPALVPLLQSEGYTPEQIKGEISGCVAGGADSYILYSPTGSYDFGAY